MVFGSRRRLGFALLLGASLSGCAEPPHAPAPAAAPPAHREPAPPVRARDAVLAATTSAREWCVSGGAALVGAPLVDAAERVYFATSDGYLHAFESDGRYRFSYTVSGTPLGSVSLRPEDGTILVGTTRRLVYAIAQTGSLRWSFETVSPVWSGIVPLDAAMVGFVGLDRFLYALTTTGAARFRVKVPGQPTGEPIVSRAGLVWVPLTDGVARIENAWRQKHLALGGAVEGAVRHERGLFLKRGDEALVLAETGEVTERHPALEIGGDGRSLAWLDRAGTLHWRTGENVLERPFTGAPPSAALFVDDEWLAVPQTNGDLILLGAEGRVETVRVAEGALRRPVRAPSGRRLVVATRDGEVCAVGLRAPGPSRSAESR